MQTVLCGSVSGNEGRMDNAFAIEIFSTTSQEWTTDTLWFSRTHLGLYGRAEKSPDVLLLNRFYMCV